MNDERASVSGNGMHEMDSMVGRDGAAKPVLQRHTTTQSILSM